MADFFLQMEQLVCDKYTIDMEECLVMNPLNSLPEFHIVVERQLATLNGS
jgi:hypothetical protein